MLVIVNLFGIKRVAMGVTYGGKVRTGSTKREVGELLLAQLRQPQLRLRRGRRTAATGQESC